MAVLSSTRDRVKIPRASIVEEVAQTLQVLGVSSTINRFEIPSAPVFVEVAQALEVPVSGGT